MRVAIIVPAGVDRSGEYRVIPAVMWIIERLARRHSVTVVTLRQEPRPSLWRSLGADIYNIGSRPRRLRAVHLLLSLHLRRPFDVFHAIWARGSGEVALAAARLCRRPVLVHIAGGELVWMPEIAFGSPRRRARWLARLVLRQADRVTAASSPMMGLARKAGASPVRVTLGADLTVWQPEPPRPRNPERPARLVHVGSLTPVKDHETLLRAVAELKRQGRDVRADLIGEDALGGRVQRLAQELGVQEAVIFHGFLPQRRAVPIVRSADLMLVTSRYEAGPVALVEAAAVGVPTVGTAVGHVVDLAPRAAVAVPVGDWNRLAAEIGCLLDNDDRRLALAEEAQKWAVRENADWTCQRFEELYEEVARRPPR
ncbi:MAG: hexosyltransferase [Gemmatimonadales bacterium]|nr:MAG: hexosyltransferase [Gemmatimonadales bacterium]